MPKHESSLNLTSIYLGVILIIASILTPYFHHSAFLAVITALAGFYIALSACKTDNNPSNQQITHNTQPNIVFKNNQAAFEYMCMYCEFEPDMTPGIVMQITTIEDYNKLKIKALINNKIAVVEDSLNFMNDETKVGDLIVCLSIMERRVASYILAPEFNPSCSSWKVINCAGNIKIKELPIKTLNINAMKAGLNSKTIYQTNL